VFVEDVDRQQLDYIAADLEWLVIPPAFTSVDQEVPYALVFSYIMQLSSQSHNALDNQTINATDASFKGTVSRDFLSSVFVSLKQTLGT
jgi:hypothetical protein